MRQKLVFTAAVIFLTVTFSGYSEELRLPSAAQVLSGLPPEARAAIDSDNLAFRYDEEGAGCKYIIPFGHYELVSQTHAELAPEVMVEAVYRIPYPENMIPFTDKSFLELYNTARKVSSMSGVKYYSWSRKKYDTLFTDVWTVSDPDSRKPLDDLLVDSVPPKDSIYVHMVENSMGRGIFRMDYLGGESSFAVSMSNASAMSMVFRVVNEGEMKILLNVIPCSDSIIIYGYCGVVLQNDGLVNFMLDPYYAFYRRMTAMETWLYNSLFDTDMLPPLHKPLP